MEQLAARAAPEVAEARAAAGWRRRRCHQAVRSVVQVDQLQIDVSGGTVALPRTAIRCRRPGRTLPAGSNTLTLGAGWIIEAGEIELFAGPRARNPFLTGNIETPYIPDLLAGAAVYGLTGLDARALFSFEVFESAPPVAGAVLIRLDIGPEGALPRPMTGCARPPATRTAASR